KKSIAEEIEALDVMDLKSVVLPRGEDDPVSKTFRYEGYDIITLEKMVDREYQLAEPQTAQEVIGYYARRIAEAVKLPAQFAAIAPKVREFFELDRKSTRLNSSHVSISYAVFCLKKK